jgi:exopolyphosphatase/pppGpp-phosphohydrolase
MIVAQIDADGGVTTLWRMKEMVGLGRISFPSRRLTKDAMDRAMMALGRFKQAAQQRQAEKIFAVATSAIREARTAATLSNAPSASWGCTSASSARATRPG